MTVRMGGGNETQRHVAPVVAPTTTQPRRIHGRTSSVVVAAMITGFLTIPAAFLIGFGLAQSEYWSARVKNFGWTRIYRTNDSVFGWSVGGFPIYIIAIALLAVFVGQVLLVRLRKREEYRWSKLQDDQTRSSFLTGSAADIVVVLATNTVVCSWSAATRHLSGLTPSSMVGRYVSACLDLRDDEDNTVTFAGWETADVLPARVQLVFPDGGRRWLSCSYRRILHRGLSQMAANVEADAMEVRTRVGDRSEMRRQRNEIIRTFPEDLLVVSARDCTDEHELLKLREDVGRLAELESAQRLRVLQLQESLQPMMPAAAGAEFGVFYSPSDQSAPTGGDFYDWQILPNGDVHLAVVDVLGNGIDATNSAFAVIHALRVLAFQGTPVDRLIREVNDVLLTFDEDLVATAVCVRYRPSTGRARIAGGGHPPPLLVRSRGDVLEIDAPGIPIGWPGAGSERAVEVTLEESETLILYTDGLVEARRDIVEGIESLSRTAAITHFLPASHLARALVETSLEGADRRDDSLALVLRRTPPKPMDLLPGFRHRGQPASRDVPKVRKKVQEWALDHPSLAPLSTDLSIALTELLTNAIRYAVSYYEVRLSFDNSSVVVEVEDDGPGFAEVPAASNGRRDDTESGRGLLIVRSIADDLHVERSQGRCIVRMQKAITPHRSPQGTAESAHASD